MKEFKVEITITAKSKRQVEELFNVDYDDFYYIKVKELDKVKKEEYEKFQKLISDYYDSGYNQCTNDIFYYVKKNKIKLDKDMIDHLKTIQKISAMSYETKQKEFKKTLTDKELWKKIDEDDHKREIEET